MNLTDSLFLRVSEILGVRVTPDNLRTQMDGIASNGGITNKIKTDILQELLMAFANLERKIDEK